MGRCATLASRMVMVRLSKMRSGVVCVNCKLEQLFWERMKRCRAIIALGTIAEYGVLKIFHRMAAQPKAWSHHDNRVTPDRQTTSADVTSWEYHYACSKRKLGSWLNSEDWWVMSESGNKRQWFMLPVYHPAYAIGREGDSGYRITLSRVQRMMAAI